MPSSSIPPVPPPLIYFTLSPKLLLSALFLALFPPLNLNLTLLCGILAHLFKLRSRLRVVKCHTVSLEAGLDHDHLHWSNAPPLPICAQNFYDSSVMYNQQAFLNHGLIARLLLTLCIPLLFLVLRSLLRQREVRRLVPPLLQIAIRHLLNQWVGGDLFVRASMSASTSTAWEMASLAGPAREMHQSRQCQPNSRILHLGS